MNTQQYFHVYRDGTRCVIGFDAKLLTDPDEARSVEQALLTLPDRNDCQLLVVDLSDAAIRSTHLLGILVALQRDGIKVELSHPNIAMRQSLEATRLDSMFNVRDCLVA